MIVKGSFCDDFLKSVSSPPPIKLANCITYSCHIKEHRVTTNGFPIKIKLLCYSCLEKGVSNLGVCFVSQINSPGRNIIFVGGENFLFDFV